MSRLFILLSLAPFWCVYLVSRFVFRGAILVITRTMSIPFDLLIEINLHRGCSYLHSTGFIVWPSVA